MNPEEIKEKKDIKEKEEPKEKEESREEGVLSKKTETKEKEEAKEQKPEKGEHEEAKSLKYRLRKKDTEVKILKKEREELKDKYLRAVAEMENLRKRLEREKSDFYQFALSEFLKELLLILDNFERALKNRDQTDGKSFQDGIEMIYKQFYDMLAKKGVSPIIIENKRFDPNVHQALLTEESDQVQEPEVGEELQKGYTLQDRLLRPTLVKVIIPKKI